MTIRFAGARHRDNPAMRAWRCRSVALCGANDNQRERPDDTMLTAALQHFARHGLAAAEQAGSLAAEAANAGDKDARAYWLAICRHFDRRLAGRLDARLRSDVN